MILPTSVVEGNDVEAHVCKHSVQANSRGIRPTGCVAMQVQHHWPAIAELVLKVVRVGAVARGSGGGWPMKGRGKRWG